MGVAGEGQPELRLVSSLGARCDCREGTQVCWSRDVSRSLVPDSGLACAECVLYHAVFRATREGPLKRSQSNLIVDFSGSLLLQDGGHAEDVVDTTDAKALAEEAKFCVRYTAGYVRA